LIAQAWRRASAIHGDIVTAAHTGFPSDSK
jgi:hypothetical protein